MHANLAGSVIAFLHEKMIKCCTLSVISLVDFFQKGHKVTAPSVGSTHLRHIATVVERAGFIRHIRARETAVGPTLRDQVVLLTDISQSRPHATVGPNTEQAVIT